MTRAKIVDILRMFTWAGEHYKSDVLLFRLSTLIFAIHSFVHHTAIKYCYFCLWTFILWSNLSLTWPSSISNKVWSIDFEINYIFDLIMYTPGCLILWRLKKEGKSFHFSLQRYFIRYFCLLRITLI